MGETGNYKTRYITNSGSYPIVDYCDLSELEKTLVRRPLTDPTSRRIFDNIEPGIFVVGGFSRDAALSELLQIPYIRMPAFTDIDYLTFGNRRITDGNERVEHLRHWSAKPGVDKVIINYLQGVDFDINQVCVGRFFPHEGPNLYIHPDAICAYEERRFDYSRQFKGVNRGIEGEIQEITNLTAALRAIFFSARYHDYGFKTKINKKLLQEALQKGWKEFKQKGVLIDYLQRCGELGILDYMIRELRYYGFTLPN